MARAWLPYLLAGLLWLALGSAVLGVPKGIGLIFVGLTCLAFGVFGAGWRVRHGYQLSPDPRRR